jgi:hypothetical protein
VTRLPAGRRNYKKKLTKREEQLVTTIKDIKDLLEYRDILILALHLEGRGCRRLAAITGMSHVTITRIVNALEDIEDDVRLLLAEREL